MAISLNRGCNHATDRLVKGDRQICFLIFYIKWHYNASCAHFVQYQYRHSTDIRKRYIAIEMGEKLMNIFCFYFLVFTVYYFCCFVCKTRKNMLNLHWLPLTRQVSLRWIRNILYESCIAINTKIIYTTVAREFAHTTLQ